ncbi:Acyl-lipid omega-3 desaturase (Cytochrome b5), endoplasmic reticulum [Mycena venus]|uniref:Acyl-lipid omega-3 desaturase (Cytochrome b5), endoplasmic reticulum n=1 Tax=Mycena venus TaxID=2733690 RepID=A0A8H7CGN2_9AGAR|nr:Acyl-lipid omega-3 desaturase (Cytochrome b5), endoplasmic reticulum [Mycena venus]
MLDFNPFKDSPEFESRKGTPFSPPQISISELHAAVPKHLFRKSTAMGLYYYARDICFIFVAYKLGCTIEPLSQRLAEVYGFGRTIELIFRWLLWVVYWHWQGVIMGGFWTLAHEAGHGTLSDYNWVNHVIGYTAHTFLLVPYYAWRSTHRAHHKKTNSLEDDEHYIPRTRSHFGLPPSSQAHITDYHDIFEETPIYSLLRLIVMQAIGMHAYLMVNALGSPKYPPGTNHFNPSSPLFKPHERGAIVASDIGLGIMMLFLFKFASHFGMGALFKLYLVPWVWANHWMVAVTFLQHSDPTIPVYRRQEWNFVRGALSTVDRPVLGWAGRFFFKNASHDHIAHHLFSSIPFYNQPQVTERIKPLLKNHYNYDSTNTFRALYRSFTQCRFIEDDGDIAFYKNKDGEAARTVQAVSEVQT